MSVVRGLCGVIVGFVIAVAVIAACERSAILIFGVRTIDAAYMMASVGWTILAAVIGGFVAAFIAGEREMPWSAGLGSLLVLLGVAMMRRHGAWQPGWYETALAGCGPISALLGGAFRLLTKPRRSETPLAAQGGGSRRSA